ncbi:caspase-14-like [Anopheles cruzii]|uniref:caspase-14-like n=1 Tax=Anopheles cruzii TaxID=68878 RepID=UPI0022EC8972|nr:caspase-14-like [Anopheles cruzii]
MSDRITSPSTSTPIMPRLSASVSNGLPTNVSYRAVQNGKLDVEYDLTKKAYVLVFHHNKFKDRSHNRPGSDKDMRKINDFFKDYRCTVRVCNDYRLNQVRRTMDEVSKMNAGPYSCVIVILMSHGMDDDTIMAYDGDMYSFEDDIVEKCTSNHKLAGKPKIFILQACRGDSIMQADAKRTTSNKCDIVTFQSTYKGNIAYRNPQEGSVFIQHLFEQLHKNKNGSIIEINTQLNYIFRNNSISQCPTMSTTLQKKLIFGHLCKSK